MRADLGAVGGQSVEALSGIDVIDLIAVEADVELQVVGRCCLLKSFSDLDPGPFHDVFVPLVVAFARTVLKQPELMDKLLNPRGEHAAEAITF